MSTRVNKKSAADAAAASTEGDRADEYTKKPKEERKGGDKPQTTRGRGSRGGYGKGRGDRKPQTARDTDAGDQAEETKGENRPNRGKDAKKGSKKTDDPDSWVNKFHNMQKPKRETIEFTVDTVVPERPSKE